MNRWRGSGRSLARGPATIAIALATIATAFATIAMGAGTVAAADAAAGTTAGTGAGTVATITSVPPATLHPKAVRKAALVQLLLSPDARARTIELPAPTAAERALVRARNQLAAPGVLKQAHPKALAIAFPRDIPAGSREIALDTLAWTTLADGTRAARIAIVSPEALAMRIALTLGATDPGVSLRFVGSGAMSAVFGPVPANSVAAATARFGRFWTPVLTGDRATIEIAVEPGASIAGIVLGVVGVSHQLVAPANLRKLGAKDLLQIGAAGSCEIDLACVSPSSAALNDEAAAVAVMDFTQTDGYGYLCTGQLLNDSIASNTPYFFTANHCIDSAYAAQTLNTYWFFQAATCGSTTPPPYVQLAAGAMLLARSEDLDWALVRLNEDPPSGARFAAWRAEPIAVSTPISVLHHPEGDLLKWSEGATQGYNQYSDRSSFAAVGYAQGSTEPGSSGAGLLTWFAPGRYYEVRGGLFQGDASCQNPRGTDDYSRLDTMLPLTRQYLTPGTPPGANEAVVVEFYNASLQHYFMTMNPSEINDLDTGVHPGWERTGLRFLAYSALVPGSSPVCRFYRTPGFGDSHFYSASPAECQAVLANPAKFPGWTYESAAVFYVALPDPVSGACPTGDVPVWRFFDQVTTNHRYTADRTIRDAMRADPATWVEEGYGPDQVIMCAPAGS